MEKGGNEKEKGREGRRKEEKREKIGEGRERIKEEGEGGERKKVHPLTIKSVTICTIRN